MPAKKRAPRRAPSKRKPRARKTCDVCGREVSANNLARHMSTHTAEVVARGATVTSSDREVAHAVRALLEQYAAAAARGKQGRVDEVVRLGRIGRGLPSSTRDPAVVEQVLAIYDAEVIPRAPNALAQLRARQRRRDLAAALEQLRASGNGSGPRAVFVEGGARWAAANGIEYATFRDMGLPAGLLRDAGIRP